MPPAFSFSVVRRPTPQTLPTSVAANSASSSCGARRARSDLRQVRGVRARLAVGGLADVVGQLGQRLGGGEADAGGQAGLFLDGGAHGVAGGGQVGAHALEVEERFVDAVDLLARRVARLDGHHARAHVEVELVVGRHRQQAGGLLEVAHLEPGLGHLDAELLRLVAARDARAVVGTQDDDGPAGKPRREHPFAADVEVVAIDQGVHAGLSRAAT
jgi:hypothetical protein